MIQGLDIFRDYFSDHRDEYVLIGGIASYLISEDIGVDFRATKDFDMVLFVECLSEEFSVMFFRFISEGGYENIEKTSGSKQFYRFSKPKNKDFPFQIELFTRGTFSLNEENSSQVTPVHISEDVSSLSAILLDDEYYEFIKSNVVEIAEVPVVNLFGLIVLKAKAWLDLRERKSRGERIDSRDIKKHKNDIVRLHILLSPEQSTNLSRNIRQDIEEFLLQIERETIDFSSIGIKGSSIESFRDRIARTFKLKD